MVYNYIHGAIKPLNWYKPLFWTFLVICCFLAYVAWHNAQPLDCSEANRFTDKETGRVMCKVELRY